MSYFNNTFWFKRFAMIISFIIVSLILWNTYVFFQRFKQDERSKMEIFASAIKEFESNTDLNASFNLENKVLEKIKGIPLILTDENDAIISYHNLNEKKATDSIYLKKQLLVMKRQNAPITINYVKDKKQFVYYRNSDLLYKLTYYPIALLLILVLFLSVVYQFFSSNKIAEQNKLWTGMAKETAHQIGTPLSSLLGWIAILKTENVSEDYISEIEKDVYRLSTIANRFSKIGSLPELQKQNIVEETKKAYDYLKSRTSTQISFNFEAQNSIINVLLNNELYGWVIENLIKNAVDAMQGKGKINVIIKEYEKQVKIFVSDTGKGIPKSQFKQIFKPGFTTKKRGWGLGLSLSKRIINNYHKGKIHVLKSEPNKGTTFEIVLNKAI